MALNARSPFLSRAGSTGDSNVIPVSGSSKVVLVSEGGGGLESKAAMERKESTGAMREKRKR